MPRIGWSDFVVWQCSLRQRNFRMFGGKPSEGTSALLMNIKTNTKISLIRSVLIEKDCLNTTKMFEFMIPPNSTVKVQALQSDNNGFITCILTGYRV